MGKKALFLDRDGTLNHDIGYTNKVEDLKIHEGVIDGLHFALNKGYILVIVTNQSGIGRGYYTIDNMFEFNQALCRELNKYEIQIKKIYYCPHSPEENCKCRKPSSELVIKASREFNIDISRSYFIGDRYSDVLCGFNAGCHTIFVETGGSKLESDSKIKPDYIIKNLTELKYILK